MFYPHEPVSELERAKHRIQMLEKALKAARVVADVEHRAAVAARESAARAWHVASLPPRRDAPTQAAGHDATQART